MINYLVEEGAVISRPYFAASVASSTFLLTSLLALVCESNDNYQVETNRSNLMENDQFTLEWTLSISV